MTKSGARRLLRAKLIYEGHPLYRGRGPVRPKYTQADFDRVRAQALADLRAHAAISVHYPADEAADDA